MHILHHIAKQFRITASSFDILTTGLVLASIASIAIKYQEARALAPEEGARYLIGEMPSYTTQHKYRI